MKNTSRVSGSGPNHSGLKTAIPAEVARENGWRVGDILVWETNGGVKIKKL